MGETPKYIPLPEVNSHPIKFKNSISQYVDNEDIGINVSAIRRLCRLGGIRNLDIEFTRGDSSSSTPEIVSFNEQGGGYAGERWRRKSVPIFDSHINRYNNNVPVSSARWIDATIHMNTTEIAKQIGEDPSQASNVRSAKAWSNHLNKGLKEGISSIGVNYLTKEITNTELTTMALLEGIPSLAILLLESYMHRLNSAPLIQFSVTNACLKVGEILGYIEFKEKYANSYDLEQGYRLSLFYGPQIDRAILLGIQAKSTTLAKPLKK